MYNKAQLIMKAYPFPVRTAGGTPKKAFIAITRNNTNEDARIIKGAGASGRVRAKIKHDDVPQNACTA